MCLDLIRENIKTECRFSKVRNYLGNELKFIESKESHDGRLCIGPCLGEDACSETLYKMF